MSSLVIVHIPHASTFIPEPELAKLAIGGEHLEREVLRMTDRHADDLFALEEAVASMLVFPVSRLVVDPERWADDEAEPMASRGMGAVYTRTSDGRPLRSRLGARERRQLLETYYFPHQRALQALVGTALREHGRCLIVDAHTFPSTPLPCDLDQAPGRPDICIGSDPFHTPAWLEQAAVAAFGGRGWRVEVNRPYAGTMVPASCYLREARVWSVLVEVNRARYMDEATGERLAGYAQTRQKVQSGVAELVRRAAGR